MQGLGLRVLGLRTTLVDSVEAAGSGLRYMVEGLRVWLRLLVGLATLRNRNNNNILFNTLKF